MVEEKGGRRPAAGPALLGVVVLAATAGLLRASQPLLSGPDAFWHWDLGRRIIASGLPATDPYSFLTSGQGWILNQWGTDALIGLVHARGGLGLLAAATALTVALAVGLVGQEMRRRSPSLLTVGMLGLVLLAILPAWTLRGSLLTILLLPLLLRELRRGEGGRLYVLLPLFVVWANLHAGYIVGVGVAVLTMAGHAIVRQPRRFGRVGGVLLGGLAAGMLTPYGPRYLVSLWEVATRASGAGISEWEPTLLTRPHVLPFTVLVALVLVALGITGRRQDLPDVVVVVAMTLFGTTAARNVAPAAIVIGILGAPHVHRGMRELRNRTPTVVPRPATQPDRMMAAGFVIFGLLVVWFTVPASPAVKSHADGIPLALISEIDAVDRPARVVTTSGWAPAVATLTDDDVRIAVDGRLELFSDEQIDDLRTVQQAADGWEAVLTRWCTTDAAVPTDAPISRALSQHPAWNERTRSPIVGNEESTATWYEYKPPSTTVDC